VFGAKRAYSQARYDYEVWQYTVSIYLALYFSPTPVFVLEQQNESNHRTKAITERLARAQPGAFSEIVHDTVRAAPNAAQWASSGIMEPTRTARLSIEDQDFIGYIDE
jgi:hypothetical protein